jgi:hypothetical protein
LLSPLLQVFLSYQHLSMIARAIHTKNRNQHKNPAPAWRIARQGQDEGM